MEGNDPVAKKLHFKKVSPPLFTYGVSEGFKKSTKRDNKPKTSQIEKKKKKKKKEKKKSKTSNTK